jgi:FkbM family methyltransferase
MLSVSIMELVADPMVSFLKKFIGRLGYRVVNASRRWGVDHLDDIYRIVGDPNKIREVFDVGANVGLTASTYAEAFPKSRVLAFEPVRGTFEMLAKNTRSNRRIVPNHCALGNFNGVTSCTLQGDSRNNSLLQGLKDQLHANSNRSEEVQVFTLDSVKEKFGIGAIDLLKIDTEGFDLAVLEGASETLRRGEIKFIYCEFHNLLRRRSVAQLGSLVELAEFIGGHNYRFLTMYTDSVHGHESIGTYNALFLINSSGFSWKF